MADYPVLLHAAIETVKISLPTVLEARRGNLSKDECDRRLRSWASSLLKRVQAEVHVDGGEHLTETAAPYVVVSNHQSLYDIPALYAGLPLSLRMAAKAELFRIPLWGAALRASGFVEIDRTAPSEARKALELAGEELRRTSTSLYIAPEGTRSSTGLLGPFKKGAFHIAQSMQLPVLPVAISGTIAIHRKDSRRVNKGVRIRLQILPPLAPLEFASAVELAEKARAAITTALLGAIPQGRGG